MISSWARTVRTVRTGCVTIAVAVAAGSSSAAFATDTTKAKLNLEIARLKREARFTEAIALLDRHVATLANPGAKPNPQTGRMLNHLAELHRLNDQLARAGELYRKVVTEFAELEGADRDVIRTALGNLTLIYMSQGNFAEAEKFTRLMNEEVRRAASNTNTPAEPSTERATHSFDQTSASERKTGAVVGRNAKSTGDRDRSGADARAGDRGRQHVFLPPPDADPAPEAPHQPSAAGEAKTPVAARPTGRTVSDQTALASSVKTPRSPQPTRPNRPRKPGGSAQTGAPGAGRPCPDPSIAVVARANTGQLAIAVVSPCRAGKGFRLTYAATTFDYALDPSGRREVVLDLFSGVTAKLSLAFDGEPAKSIAIPALEMANLTKVAIVWDAPVNLDLHVNEYAARPGSDGHVWAGNNRTYGQVASLVAVNKRAHGWISRIGNANDKGTKAEVFTLIRWPGQKFGAISLALDFQSRGSELSPPYCGDAPMAMVRFKVFRLDGTAPLTVRRGLIPAGKCGTRLDNAARYLWSAVNDIRIRR